ncbi:unnamed protein product, partial [Symbiodinium sp. KB8]
PASPAAVALAAQLASVDQPHVAPARGAGTAGSRGAGRAIVSPFQRFHKRLSEADGGRQGVSAARGGAGAPPAGASVNLSALRRVPGLGAAVGGGGPDDGSVLGGGTLRGGAALLEGTSASLTAAPHGRTPSLAAGGAVDPVLERAGRSADAAADAAEAALRRWAGRGAGAAPDAAALSASRRGATLRLTRTGNAAAGGIAPAVDDDEALSGDPAAVVAAMSRSVGRVPGAREQAAMRATREPAGLTVGAEGSHGGSTVRAPAPRPALPRETVPPVVLPTRLALPELVGRVVTRVVCGAGVTAAFAPSVVSECLPPLGWSTGGKGWMAVAGAGLAAVAAGALRAVGEAAAALPPRCRERGVGRALPGVLVRFTRPGVVPAAALEGDIGQPSPEDLEGFSPDEDAQAAAAEPLVRFVRAYEALPGSELAKEASASALRAGRGARVGMAVDAIVCRAPDFPSACDVVVELLVRDRSARDGGGGVEVPADAWGRHAGSAAGGQGGAEDFPEAEEDEEDEAAASAEAAAAAEEAAAGAWIVVRGAAAAAFCEKPELKTASPEAAVLPAGATVTLRGDRLLGLLQKDTLAREAAARVVREVEEAMAAKEEEEAAEAARQAEELYGGAAGGAAVPAALAGQPLRVGTSGCGPAATLIRWRILNPGADEADSVVTDPQPCWWSLGFEEAPAPDSGEAAAEGASAGGASAVSVGATSAQMLAGGGGGEESGEPVLGEFSAELITTLPAMDPALLPAASAGAPLVVWPELSPNGMQWVAFRRAALEGVCPVLEGIARPAVVPMCPGSGSDGAGACALHVQGAGCVDTGSVLARLALVEASEQPEAAAQAAETTVQLAVADDGLVSAGRSLFDALQASGLVPVGGWATFEVDVSFDGGERFLALPDGSSIITVVDGQATPVLQPLLPADVPFWLGVDVGFAEGGAAGGSDEAVARPRWMEAPGVMESLVVSVRVTGTGASPVGPAAALAIEEQTDEASGAAQLGVHVDMGAAVEAAAAVSSDAEEWAAPLMLEADVGLAGFAGLGREASPAAAPASLFSASRCSVSAVGPKKIGPGAALDISVTGLATSRIAADAVAAAQARVWVSTEDGQSPASGDGLATLPSIDEGLKPGEQSFSVSFDKGLSWSQLARAKECHGGVLCAAGATASRHTEFAVEQFNRALRQSNEPLSLNVFVDVLDPKHVMETRDGVPPPVRMARVTEDTVVAPALDEAELAEAHRVPLGPWHQVMPPVPADSISTSLEPPLMATSQWYQVAVVSTPSGFLVVAAALGITSMRIRDWSSTVSNLHERWQAVHEELTGDELIKTAGLPASDMAGGGPLLARLSLPAQPECLDIEPHLQTVLACICDGHPWVIPMAALMPNCAAAAEAYAENEGATGKQLMEDPEEEEAEAQQDAESEQDSSDDEQDAAGDDGPFSYDPLDAETFTAIAAGAEYFPEYMLPGTGGTVNVHCRWAGLPKGVRWETLEWRGVAHGCGALILLMGMHEAPPGGVAAAAAGGDSAGAREVAVLDANSGCCLLRSGPLRGLTSAGWAPAGKGNRSPKAGCKSSDLGGGALIGMEDGSLSVWACGAAMREARASCLATSRQEWEPVVCGPETMKLLIRTNVPDEGSLVRIGDRSSNTGIWGGFLAPGHELVFIKRMFRHRPVRARCSPLLLGWRPAANGPLAKVPPGGCAARFPGANADCGGTLAMAVLSQDDTGLDLRATKAFHPIDSLSSAVEQQPAKFLPMIRAGEFDDDDALSHSDQPAVAGAGLNGHENDELGRGFAGFQNWQLSLLGEVVPPQHQASAVEARTKARFMVAGHDRSGFAFVSHTAGSKVGVLCPWFPASEAEPETRVCRLGSWRSIDVTAQPQGTGVGVEPKVLCATDGSQPLITSLAFADCDSNLIPPSKLLMPAAAGGQRCGTVFATSNWGSFEGFSVLDSRMPRTGFEASQLSTLRRRCMVAEPLRSRCAVAMGPGADAPSGVPSGQQWLDIAAVTPLRPPPTVGEGWEGIAEMTTDAIGDDSGHYFGHAWKLMDAQAGFAAQLRDPYGSVARLELSPESLAPHGASLWAYADWRLVGKAASTWPAVASGRVLPAGACAEEEEDEEYEDGELVVAHQGQGDQGIGPEEEEEE